VAYLKVSEPVTDSTPIHLSASAISAFKACPERYHKAYEEGIRPLEDTDGLRIGTHWHSIHEAYRHHDEEMVYETGLEPFAAAIAVLDGLYAVIPATKTAEEWTAERAILAGCFTAWVHLMPEPAPTLVTELSFELPLLHPATGLPVAGVDIRGKIDRLVRVGPKRIVIRDYKSTSKQISADSTFWAHLRLDTQISLYIYAARMMQAAGDLREYGITDDDEIVGAWYDVWHKPTITAKMLTQAATKAFIETGEYMEQKFEIEHAVTSDGMEASSVRVNGIDAEIEPGKKGFAVRETPDMFCSRLMMDCVERPDFYFASREITRTDADMQTFTAQLYHICQAIKAMRRGTHWYQNEQQCEATFRCPYIPCCYSHIDTSDGHTPAGFRRIERQQVASVITSLTIEQEHTEL